MYFEREVTAYVGEVDVNVEYDITGSEFWDMCGSTDRDEIIDSISPEMLARYHGTQGIVEIINSDEDNYIDIAKLIEELFKILKNEVSDDELHAAFENVYNLMLTNNFNTVIPEEEFEERFEQAVRSTAATSQAPVAPNPIEQEPLRLSAPLLQGLIACLPLNDEQFEALPPIITEGFQKRLADQPTPQTSISELQHMLRGLEPDQPISKEMLAELQALAS
jgi:hypothetical protein